VIPMYYIQQPIEQPLSLGLEARILHQRMVAGHESEMYIVGVGPLP
jgi:hypothetical protein